MKQFETISELDILRFANTTILSRWVRERERVDHNPDNEIAKYHMRCYWAMLEDLHSEICRLEREAKQN